MKFHLSTAEGNVFTGHGAIMAANIFNSPPAVAFSRVRGFNCFSGVGDDLEGQPDRSHHERPGKDPEAAGNEE